MTALLEVENLSVHYGRSRRRPGHAAVDGVSLTVGPGEAVGLVGESGSGKTTIGRAILGLAAPTGGSLHFDGADVTDVPAEKRAGQAADLQVIFQDPYGSLNPSRTIRQILTEPLTARGALTREAANQRVGRLLHQVGLPADALDRYPAAFSGGQRQRIAIARALTSEPKLVICDEPVSALDVSTQAQVLNLLADLRSELGLAYLFIGHNLAVVRNVCDRVVVLYEGRVMESGPAAELIVTPLHPYTRALVAAAPVADVAAQRLRREARRATLAAAPDLSEPVAGSSSCPFASRCPDAETVCGLRRPRVFTVGAFTVACHMYDRDSGHTQIRD
ncbi:oligopeptide/dipeptide ABC transporter ATP-binding protein [Catenulispora rubra]|uniref:oligopeptide/dipeptide ABC transporter ATP-binding protein n=1 Tax=Catenulispora rubra TaxID=280293 RepID=UPI0018920F05|nr:ABC transporter ATP-binding protein [Catenulispora rubra]